MTNRDAAQAARIAVVLVVFITVFALTMRWATSSTMLAQVTLYKPVAHIVLKGERLDKLTKTEPPVPLAECLAALDTDKAMLEGIVAQFGALAVSQALGVKLPEGFVFEMGCEAVGQRDAVKGLSR